jgi:hypothetical protein
LRATQIPEEHAELLAKMRGNKLFREAVDSTLELGLGRGRGEYADVLARTITAHLEVSYPYYVTRDMSLLVQHAADGLDDEDLFDPELAPTGAGIARFERPLDIFDVRGWHMKGHWMTWGPTPGGMLVSVWNDTRDPDDIVTLLVGEHGARVKQVMGNWSIIGGTFMKRGETLGPMRNPVPDRYIDDLVSEGVDPVPFTNVERLAQALWLLLDQTLVSTHEEQARPKQTHHARRLNLKTRVTVIDLRRIEGMNRGHGESTIEWHHRWVVRGHWRWQACGVGHTERRRIWIAPFIKGPEDAPLAVTNHVYALRR